METYFIVLCFKQEEICTHAPLNIHCDTCKRTQVSHGPSFDRSVLTVLLQVDYMRWGHIKNG